MGLLSGLTDFLFGWLIPEQPKQDIGVDVTKADTDAHIPVAYGRCHGGGLIVYQATNDNDNDDVKNDLLHQIVVWSEGNCGGVLKNFVDDELSTSVRFNADDGFKWFYAENFTNGLLGFTDQLLTQSGKRSTDTFDGKLVSYCRSEMTDGEVWSGPPNHKAEFEGRLISAPTEIIGITPEFIPSENPVDQLFDLLKSPIYGKGLSSDFIDIGSFAASRPVCDTLVETYPASGVNRKLFTSNIILDTSNTVLDNVNTLLKSMRGWLFHSDGKLKLLIEKDDAPVDFSIDENDQGFIEFGEVKNSSKSNRYNRVVCRYTDPDSGWTQQEVIYPEPGSAEETALLAEDNGVLLEKSIALDTCIYYHEAAHHAKTILQISREQLRTSVTWGPEAVILEVGDIVPVTRSALGWDGKLFRIETTEKSTQDGTVQLKLREHQPYLYDDANLGDKPVLPDTNIVYDAPAAPTNLAVEAVYDTYNQVRFTWDGTTKNYAVVVTDATGTPLFGASVARKEYSVNTLEIGNYIFEVQAVGGLGRRSAFTTLSFAITNAPTPTTNIEIDNGDGAIVVTPPTPDQQQAIYEGVYTTNVNLDPNVDDISLFRRATGGRTITIPAPAHGVTYYVWYRLVTPEGNGLWQVKEVVGQGITLDNVDIVLKEDIEYTLNAIGAFDVDLGATIPSEISRVDSAVKRVDAATINLSEALESSLASAASAFTNAGKNIDKSYGLRNEFQQVADQVSVVQTDIDQKADSITLSAVRAELKGDITAIVSGDSSAAVNAALGDLTGRVEAAELKVEPQAITASVEAVVLEQNLASISDVTSQINALGISDYVTTATFTPEVTRIDAAEQTLQGGLFKRSLTSYSTLSAENNTLGERLLIATISKFLAQSDLKDLEGTLADVDKSIIATTDELSARTTQTESALSLASGNIATAFNEIETVASEQQATASELTQYKVDAGILIDDAEANAVATAEAFTRATVGYCVLDDGITTHTDKSACELAGGTWETLPLSEAINKVSLSITRPDNTTVSGSAGNLFQVLTDDYGNLLTRAFFGVNVDGEVTGIVATDTSGAETSGTIDLLGDKVRILNPTSKAPFVSFDTVNDRAVIRGQLVLEDGNEITTIADIQAQNGRGVSSMTRSGETVTVTYTDNTTDTFTVTNGTSPDPLTVSTVVKVGQNTTITLSDNTSFVIDDGQAGLGIQSISKTGETVTVTFDDNTTDTFTVIDGKDGKDALGALPASILPAAQGGSADIVYKLNQELNGTANNAELSIVGSRFIHPSGTAKTFSDVRLITCFGEPADTNVDGAQGNFFIMWTDTPAQTRTALAHHVTDCNFLVVAYNETDSTWEAVGNNNAREALTLTGTDCFIAAGYAENANTGGITSIYSFTNGAEGKAGAGSYTLILREGVFPADATATSDFTSNFGRAPVIDDHLTYANATNTVSSVKRYNGTVWVTPTLVINGDVLTKGTVTGDRLVAGTEIAAPVITGGTLQTSDGTAHRVIVSDSDDYPIWVGSGTKTAANATFYIKTDGTGFISGEFFQGQITREKSAINTNGKIATALGHESAGRSVRVKGKFLYSSSFSSSTKKQSFTVAWEIRRGVTVIDSGSFPAEIFQELESGTWNGSYTSSLSITTFDSAAVDGQTYDYTFEITTTLPSGVTVSTLRTSVETYENLIG